MQIFENQCYGCGACSAVCPQNAVSMVPGPDGHLLPQVEEAKCVRCGLCEVACPDRHPPIRRRPGKAYAAACRDEILRQGSASGGAFAALAQAVLTRGGVVFGCAMPVGEKNPRHILVDAEENLGGLQGSKYAQSRVWDVYPQAKEQLEKGRLVLFSGTPCQIGGLKSYLRHKQYDNLLTVDLICHGVPSAKMLEDYLTLLERQRKIQIRRFLFRGKEKGWGSFRFRMDYRSRTGKEKTVALPANRSSYYWLFLKGAAYRENCYRCPYASMERAADLTLGDFWGISETYPGLLGQFDEKTGISCVLVNSEAGEKAMRELGDGLKLQPVDPEAVAKHNAQLRHSQQKPAFFDEVMARYARDGYEAVEKWYQKRLGWKAWAHKIKDHLPWK